MSILAPGANTLDLRLVPGALALWAGAGLAPSIPAVRAVVLGCLLLAGCLAALLFRRSWSVTAAVVLTCAAAGLTASTARVAATSSGPLPDLARQGAFVTVEVELTSDPHRYDTTSHGPGMWRALVLARARAHVVEHAGRATGVRAPVLVLGSGRSWWPLLPSQRLRVSGRLSVPHDPGSTAAVLHTRGTPRVLGPPTDLQEVAGWLRAGLRQAVHDLPPAQRGLVPGLVVGDTSGMPAATERSFREAGMSHLTAVSGANIAIVIALVVGLGRWVGVRGRLLSVLALVGVAGFVVLCRPEPSVLRATVMGTIALGALAVGRPRMGLPALAASVIVLVLVDPALSRSLGFALSVSATAGILVLAPACAAWLRARGSPAPFADALAVTASAQAACGPVLAATVAQVSLVAVPANLLAAPAVAPATVLGLAATLAAPASQRLAELAGWLSGLPAWWIVTVADWAARLPASTLSWPAGIWGAVALVGVTLLAVFVIVQLVHRPPVGAAAVAVLVALAGVYATAPGWPPPGWLLVACDVGQGDALVLSVVPGTAVVVDAGPEPVAVNACLRDLDVRRVPLVVLTHPHADHVTGLPGVLADRDVGEIQVTGAGGVADPRVPVWARARAVPVTTAYAGESRRVGPVTWTLVWPLASVPEEGSVENNASIVLAVRSAGVRLLLTGDIEPAAQQALLATGADVRADVLKVPHHGSRHQLPEFLDRVNPVVTVTSVGSDNDYGHPAPATMRALSAGGAVQGRTDWHGDVAVVGPRDDLRLVSRGADDHAGALAALCHASGRVCVRLAAQPGSRERPGGPARRTGGLPPGGPRSRAASRGRDRPRGRQRAAAGTVECPRQSLAVRRRPGRGPPRGSRRHGRRPA